MRRLRSWQSSACRYFCEDKRENNAGWRALSHAGRRRSKAETESMGGIDVLIPAPASTNSRSGGLLSSSCKTPRPICPRRQSSSLQKPPLFLRTRYLKYLSMPSLPDPGGRFPVGATTFVRPIRPALAIGKSQVNKPTSSAKHSHLHNTTHSAKDNLEPTLVLEEVAFTVYYPADLRHGGGWLGGKVAKHSIGLDWVPKPAEETVRGYEHFGGM